MSMESTANEANGAQASRADRLQADLLELSALLGNYRDDRSRKDEIAKLLSEAANAAQGLETFSKRFDALPVKLSNGHVALAEEDQQQMQRALSLREVLMTTVRSLQAEAEHRQS